MDDEPSYQINVTCEGDISAHEAEMARSATEAALRGHGVKEAGISLALVSDARIAKLNERFLGHDGPTDVLTFDLGEGDVEAGRLALTGEIVISWETAAREGQARGHGTDREIALYAVHGVLHLLGYDDADEVSAARMHAVEDGILSALGMGRVYGTPVTR